MLAANQWAIIGDYGTNSSGELAVANMVKSWDPAFIITTGDNNYPKGAASTIDINIGKYYQEFIGNYQGTYGPGSPTNRFFPSLGNHDWETSGAQPYLNYFTLPGNERYYDFVQDSTHFFAIDSDSHEPDGVTATSKQATWLHNALTASTSEFNVVYFHHPPYSSHAATAGMRWPFKEWGADIVFSGHYHNYERKTVDGLPYVVVGNSGESGGNTAFGAMRVTDEGSQLKFDFFSPSNGGKLYDSFVVLGDGPAPTGLSINDITVTEGDAGTADAVFTVTLSAASVDPVTVVYATEDGTAKDVDDYQSQSGILTFDPGVTSLTISVPIVGDSLTENKESFVVKLSDPNGAALGKSVGTGTIADNDAPTLTYYLSLESGATLVSAGGSTLPVADADIFRLDVPPTGAHQFSSYFDGSDVGLSTADEDIDAFDILPDGSIVVSTVGSFSLSATYASPEVGSGATLTGTNRDLLKFTPTALGDNTTGTWSIFLIGAAAGLEASGEDIDAVSVLADGRVIVSVGVSASAGGVSAKDEDLLIYTPSTGGWALYFDGSDVSLDNSPEDVDGLYLQPSTTGGNPTLYFSTRDKFSVKGVTGADEDIFAFVPTQLGKTTKGTFALTLDGGLYGLSNSDVDGMHVGAVPALPPTPPPSPPSGSSTPSSGVGKPTPSGVLALGKLLASGGFSSTTISLGNLPAPVVSPAAKQIVARYADRVFAAQLARWLPIAVKRPAVAKVVTELVAL